MKLTNRGQKVVGIASVFGFLAIMGIVGAIETQDMPTCEDYQASQDWESAWERGCPFVDESGNYLYTWTP